MLVHQKQWDFFKKKFALGQLSHAYIFSGQEGIGKKAFAMEFARYMYCLAPEKSCGKCRRCNLIEKGNFPDLVVVTSAQSTSSVKNEKDMMEIDVAQIRDVNNFLSLTSYYGGYKMVIIDQAERMNPEAQNCFLKTLEEPKGNTVIILLSSRPELLLPTIASRCQLISFFPFEKYQLNAKEQALLKELLPIITAELATKFQYAKKVNLEGSALSDILKVLRYHFRNMMLTNLGAASSSRAEVAKYPISKIKSIISQIETLQTQFFTGNINQKLALEILLLEI